MAIRTKGSGKLDQKAQKALDEYKSEMDSLRDQMDTAWETLTDEIEGLLDEAYDEGIAEAEAGADI